MKRFLAFLFILVYQYGIANAQLISSIDSLYMSSLTDFSKNIDNIKEKVWPGMQIGPYCIFRLNGPAFLLNHPNPPKNAKLLNGNIYLLKQSDFKLNGATQTEINNLLTAHNDYGQKNYSSVNQFYAELFHEIHHVYQRNFVKNLRYDNPADLLTYPEDDKNDAIKQYENKILLEMLLGAPKKFKDNLNLFYTFRNKRLEIIGSRYLDYEKSAESVEGPAMFCEYQYMQQVSKDVEEQEYIHHRYFYSLIEPAYGRNGLRGKCLLTGLIQCLILSNHFPNWQSEYYSSGLYLYDYFIKKFLPRETVLPDLSFYQAKAKYFTEIERQKHLFNYDNFNKQSGIKLTLTFKETPEFRGFDPMHAEAINDNIILHSTLFNLGRGSNSLNIVNYKAISIITDQIWFVKTVVLFVPENSISFENDELLCNNGSVGIKWKLVSKTIKGNEYIITLE